MQFRQTLKDSLYWFKNLLVDLSTKRSLGYILIIALVVTLTAGVLLYIIDSNIHSPLDGIWSAWVTMTHVGFGDVVPTSFFGRLLAALLILFGLAVFSLFTASLSVVLIGKNIDALGLEMRHVEREASRIESEESLVLKELARLHQRMDELENRLESLRSK
jgi:voltage-gated potassium channel